MSIKYTVHYPDAKDPDNKFGKYLVGQTNNKEVIDEIPNIQAKLGDQRWRYCIHPSPNGPSEEDIWADGGLTYHKNKVKVDYKKDVRRRRKLEFRKYGLGILNNNEGKDDEVWTTNNLYSAWVHSMERAHEIHMKEVEEEVARKGYYWDRGIKVPYEPSRQLGEASESLVKQKMP